jgi:hypothetical protein
MLAVCFVLRYFVRCSFELGANITLVAAAAPAHIFHPIGCLSPFVWKPPLSLVGGRATEGEHIAELIGWPGP